MSDNTDDPLKLFKIPHMYSDEQCLNKNTARTELSFRQYTSLKVKGTGFKYKNWISTTDAETLI
jgi:hypothetical protein